MSNKKNYFTNKNVLITGITGFVGSNLAKKMESLGAHVYGISQRASGKNILKADILNFSELEQFVKDKKINIYFHLAGISLVEKGQSDPMDTFKINIQGTINILELGRKYSAEKVIIASTSHVYGNNKPPFLERYTPRPSRPYETSKASADVIAQSYADTYNLPVIIPRFVNIYGPGDLNKKRLIPQTIQSVLSKMSPKIWGGESVRDYLYIDDAIEAYVKLAALDKGLVGKNKIFNIGAGNPISVEKLVRKIIALSGEKLEIERIAGDRVAEISIQYVSSSRAKKLINWKPKYSLDQGLAQTIKWYKNNG